MTGAAVGALRGGGSANPDPLLRNGVAVGNLDHESEPLPAYDDDEGYADADDTDAPLTSMSHGGNWNWGNIDRERSENGSDNAGFDHEDLDGRMNDFDDDFPPGNSTPVHNMDLEMDTVLPEPMHEDELAEIHVGGSHGKHD